MRIWTANISPKAIGRFYLDYLYESKGYIQKVKVHTSKSMHKQDVFKI